jgi:hypothetical protein
MKATGIKNHGRRMAIRIRAPAILEAVIVNILAESPSRLSMVSISLENRFIIRPRGWVDKAS